MTPKVRRDGRCVVCRGPRPFTPQRGVPVEAYLGDPFCSAHCARKFYGTVLPISPSGSKGRKGYFYKGEEPPEGTALATDVAPPRQEV